MARVQRRFEAQARRVHCGANAPEPAAGVAWVVARARLAWRYDAMGPEERLPSLALPLKL